MLYFLEAPQTLNTTWTNLISTGLPTVYSTESPAVYSTGIPDTQTEDIPDQSTILTTAQSDQSTRPTAQPDQSTSTTTQPDQSTSTTTAQPDQSTITTAVQPDQPTGTPTPCTSNIGSTLAKAIVDLNNDYRRRENQAASMNRIVSQPVFVVIVCKNKLRF